MKVSFFAPPPSKKSIFLRFRCLLFISRRPMDAAAKRHTHSPWKEFTAVLHPILLNLARSESTSGKEKDSLHFTAAAFGDLLGASVGRSVVHFLSQATDVPCGKNELNNNMQRVLILEPAQEGLKEQRHFIIRPLVNELGN